MHGRQLLQDMYTVCKDQIRVVGTSIISDIYRVCVCVCVCVCVIQLFIVNPKTTSIHISWKLQCMWFYACLFNLISYYQYFIAIKKFFRYDCWWLHNMVFGLLFILFKIISLLANMWIVNNCPWMAAQGCSWSGSLLCLWLIPRDR
jgi:hypothetical protein